jgi:ATP-binding cassette subfamily F protein uup
MQNREFKQAQGKVEISTAGRRIGKKVVELNGVSKAYDHRALIHEFTYAFNPEDRIGVIGGNGTGKSTLMNLITGRVQPDSGTIEVGSTIQIGYFDQHSEDLLLDPNQRVIEYLKDVAELVKTADGSVITASQMLERFLFTPNQQYAPINKLSGGERRRLFLLRVLMSAPNLLILDEPTNDLDVQTLSVLEEYLEDFNGCVIIVSHDRYFLDRTVDTILAIEPGGVIRQYPGNYSVYLEHREREAAEAEPAKEKQVNGSASELKPEAKSAESAKPDAKSKRLSYKQKRELEQLEIEIPQLEAEKEQLEKTLYGNSSNNFTEMQTLTQRLATLEQTIESATERWLELAELQ